MTTTMMQPLCAARHTPYGATQQLTCVLEVDETGNHSGNHRAWQRREHGRYMLWEWNEHETYGHSHS